MEIGESNKDLHLKEKGNQSGSFSMQNGFARLRTFLKWPEKAQTSSVLLSDNGFYYVGIGDTVKCCSCEAELKDWTFTDHPIQRHKAVSPNCEFIKDINLDELSHENTPGRSDVTQNSPGFNENSIEAVTTHPRETHHNGYHARSKTPEIPPVKSLEKTEVDYTIFENRVRSYNGKWSTKFPVQPLNLAKAGFYYIGPDDRVKCAWCKGVLYKFEAGDNALVEHHKYFGRCPFIVNKYYDYQNGPELKEFKSQNKSECSQRQTLQKQATPKKTINIENLNVVKVILKLGYSIDAVRLAVTRLANDGERIEKITVDQLIDALHEAECNGSTEERTQDQQLASPQDPELLSLQKENAFLKDKTLCKICLDNEVEILLLPCRHIICCESCEASLTLCPICRTKIIGTVKAFLP